MEEQKIDPIKDLLEPVYDHIVFNQERIKTLDVCEEANFVRIDVRFADTFIERRWVNGGGE